MITVELMTNERRRRQTGGGSKLRFDTTVMLLGSKLSPQSSVPHAHTELTCGMLLWLELFPACDDDM